MTTSINSAIGEKPAAHAEGFRKLSGGSTETALSKSIAELYNKGKRSNFILIGESRG